MKLFFVLVALMVLMPATSKGAQELLDPVYDAALAGDGVKAIAALAKLDATTFDSQEATRASCIRRALLSSPPPQEELPPATNSILFAYRTYWQQSMTQTNTRDGAETQLKNQIDAILTARNPAHVASDSLKIASEKAKQAIEEDGLFVLTGITSPYYELAIWKTQESRTYRVDLNDRQIETQVVFLDNFVSFGWSGYATCDRFHTGGWATETALFAVRSAYDLDSENFRISYLGHESRHFSDYRRFPKLEQPELEYRAKLTELALAKKSTHELIAIFARRTGEDRSSPHDFANYWVVKYLSKAILKSDVLIDDAGRWKRVPTRSISNAARRLLASNDADLMRKNSKSITRFLEN